jgi:predicted lipoprotein with Yx(FWY)xxD motif
MTRSRPLTFLAGAAVIPLVALAVAGCGGGSGASAAAVAPEATSGASATLGVATTDLGEVLVDSKGRTLYLFKSDRGTTSTCFGACATDWPPLRVNGKPTVAGDTNPSLIATTSRSDGKPQVTYGGHPLYLYAGDQKPGDTNGQGVVTFGAGWYAVTPAGTQVSAQTASSDSTGGW